MIDPIDLTDDDTKRALGALQDSDRAVVEHHSPIPERCRMHRLRHRI